MTQTSTDRRTARPWTGVILFGGAGSALIGALALLGWVLDVGLLSAIDDRLIPMAPSTAILFVLFGVLAALDGGRGAGERGFARPLAGVGTAVALVLLGLSLAGIETDLEHFGVDLTDTVAGASVGHMSILTALGFVIAGAAFLLSTPPTRPGRTRLSFVLAMLLEVLAATLVTGYLLGSPFLYGTGAIPPALNTSLAFAALGLALLGIAARWIWAESYALQDGTGPGYAWLAALCLAIVVIVGGSAVLFRDHQASFEERVDDQLLAVADMKLALITEWREELLRDASAFYANSGFASLVEDAIYGEDEEARSRLRAWLDPIQRSFRYRRMAVLDSTGLSRLAVPDEAAGIDSAQHSAQDAVRVLRAGRPTLEGFHRDSPGGPIHMTVVIPIRNQDGTGIAVLAIRVDPEIYLYPALRQWPTPSRTAETLLVRRDGDDVLFLNDLRFRDSTALRLRIPLSDPDLPAARAILGADGIVEGVDYRGEPVVAAVRPIPNSDWRLVARMDIAEAYGPLRQRRALTLAVVALFLLTTAIGMGFAWQRREKLHLRSRFEAEERNRTVLHSIGDAVITTDAEGRVEFINPVATELTGWSNTEARGRPLGEVFRIVNEDSREPVLNPAEEVVRTGSIVGLANSTVLIARDGTERPIADSAAPIRVGTSEISGVVLVFRDQTEQRAAQQALEAAARETQRYLDVSAVMIVVLDREGRVRVINRRGTEILGLPADEIVGRNWFDDFVPDSARDRVRAVHDRNVAGHLEAVRSAESPVLTRDGDERIIAWNNAVVRDEEGRVDGTISSGQDVTERREAERAVRQSEARYRNLFESIRDAIIVADTDRRITGCNAAFTELFGYGMDDVVGQQTGVLYESQEEFRRVGELLQARMGDPHFVVTIQYRKKSGETFPGETSAFYLTNSDGETIGFIGLVRDVTKRMEAERAREQSEARYVDLVEAAPMGIFNTRSDGRALACNRAMARILGFDTPAEVVSHYDDLGHELYVRPERREEFLRELRENGSIEAFQYEARRADGRVIWIEMNARLARWNPDGTFDIQGFSWDVTDRKRSQDRLRRQQNMLERTERIAHIGSFEYDPATDTITWSDELFRILGLDPAGRAPQLGEYEDLLPGDDLGRLQQAILTALDDGQPFDFELSVVRSDDEVRQCRVRGHTETDESGRITRLYGSLADITEQAEREATERELRAQLAQAQKMEAVGRLAGGVAHDFNNMLSVILGHVELAQEDVDPDDPLKADLEEVRRAAQSSAELTRQLLAFAREQVASPEVLDPNETVSGMLGMLRRLIGENIELDWAPADDAWWIKVDPVQVHQVLANLLVNARDAITGVGRITIETRNVTIDAYGAELHADAAEGDYVALSVSDTGVGMEADVAARVFDPFFTTKEVGEGTGLGLATVYGIVRQNDGFVAVYSEPGYGTTFKVYFPRHDAPERDSEAAGTHKEAAGLRGSETLLVVEDQPAVLRLVTKSMERLGYSVLAAGSPEHATELAAEYEGTIHLLITDVIMPGMNGRDLASRLTADRPELATLYMSGYAEDVIAQRGVIEEGVHFVEKPFSGTTLAAKVRAAIEAKQS